jgi:hypothetical protein
MVHAYILKKKRLWLSSLNRSFYQRISLILWSRGERQDSRVLPHLGKCGNGTYTTGYWKLSWYSREMMVCLSPRSGSQGCTNTFAVRFALKVGLGASLYAMFAFIPLTRPFYQVSRQAPSPMFKHPLSYLL